MVLAIERRDRNPPGPRPAPVDLRPHHQPQGVDRHQPLWQPPRQGVRPHLRRGPEPPRHDPPEHRGLRGRVPRTGCSHIHRSHIPRPSVGFEQPPMCLGGGLCAIFSLRMFGCSLCLIQSLKQLKSSNYRGAHVFISRFPHCRLQKPQTPY